MVALYRTSTVGVVRGWAEDGSVPRNVRSTLGFGRCTCCLATTLATELISELPTRSAGSRRQLETPSNSESPKKRNTYARNTPELSALFRDNIRLIELRAQTWTTPTSTSCREMSIASAHEPPMQANGTYRASRNKQGTQRAACTAE